VYSSSLGPTQCGHPLWVSVVSTGDGFGHCWRRNGLLYASLNRIKVRVPLRHAKRFYFQSLETFLFEEWEEITGTFSCNVVRDYM